MRMTAAAILALSTALTTPAMAQAPASEAARTAEPVRYTAEQFFGTTSYAMASPAGHAVSPDGRNLLISSDASGVFNVYLLPLAGGEPAPVTQSADNANFAASFFPADERILYTADQGGNELDHVYVRAADGTVRDLTPGENLKADFVGWSDDGATFYIVSNERDPEAFDLYAYDAENYERRLVFQNSARTAIFISPTSRRTRPPRRG